MIHWNSVILGMLIATAVIPMIDWLAFEWPSKPTIERCKEIAREYSK